MTEAVKEVSNVSAVTMVQAVARTLDQEMDRDKRVVIMGEDVGKRGGVFLATDKLFDKYGPDRVIDSPLSEAAIIGAGVGYALSGGRALVELMYCDFLGRAGDEIFNQAAKWQSMSAGLLEMPLVMRVSVGSKYGAQHSQDWSALVAHMPGLKAYYPATPYDAKGMMNLALRGTDPVVFFESQKLYDRAEEFVEGGVPEDYYEIPEGEPVVRRAGSDITIGVLGATLYVVMEAADILEEKYGISAEVIDLRFVAPLNHDPIVESVKKTGRLLLTSDAVDRGSFLHNVASTVQTMAFDYLDAPTTVVGSRNAITPAAELEEEFFPQPEWLIDAIHERILPLEGHEPATNQTVSELARRARKGL